MDDVVEQQIQKEDAAKEKPEPETPADAPSEFTGVSAASYTPDQIDYDLTGMGSDMIYATVFDMVSNPESYEGRVIRIFGPYYHLFYEPTQLDYYGVIIQDATACCAQGIEFVWDDGSHAFPEEYPAEYSEVVVTGRFEAYFEGEQRYIHLVNASLELA